MSRDDIVSDDDGLEHRLRDHLASDVSGPFVEVISSGVA